MREVTVGTADLAAYQQVLGPERSATLRSGAGRLAALLAGRTVWNVNSTAAGGGVAELLHSLVPLARALGVPVRWLVIDGDAEFFAITKRLCTLVYGSPGDGGPTGEAEREHYRKVTEANAADLAGFVRPGDVVIVHEAQPAGLVPAAARLGAKVVYRSHTGCDTPNEHTARGWAFIRPYVEQADATVFLIPPHVQPWAPAPQVVAPSIDPCLPKNVALSQDEAVEVLRAVGALAGGAADGGPVTVSPGGGPSIELRRPVIAVREGDPPPADAPMVVQVSRWDRLKDMAGVLRSFVAADVPGSYLTLAGSDVTGVSDDPEAEEMFVECRREWERLPTELRARIQLLCLPMADPRENALVVNALQQHATVVVQKSVAEGFGLTATEAMWKSRPLLANAVGGLRTQVVPDESGLLLDPTRPDGAAGGIARVLADPALADRLGAGARRRVHENYLPDRHLLQWGDLIETLVKEDDPDASAR
ncbi:glycosyltransferase [Micromonospora sp. WMMD882]|uniref:glycosyltransferase n=1 Tax=Micromonospora sp. WMMD882 TaxID=3015151 RepID=UPI00248BF190|nr:glycosyltransferase [Micromonospora sp. WMMD882]WBB78676.1 glycosyltransferase [Micromonospora sp. WMMD882]